MSLVSLDPTIEQVPLQDEFTDATCSLDAPDLFDHMSNMDLYDTADDLDSEDERKLVTDEEETYSDSDSNYSSSVSILSKMSGISQTSTTSISSIDSIGQAHFTRPANGGELEVRFSRGPKLDPALLVSLIASRLRPRNPLELVGTSNDCSDGYNIKLKGIQHGEITGKHLCLVWMPEEITLLQQTR
jgi:hypothetical protein